MSEGALALGGELLERDQTFAVLDGLLVGVGAGRTGQLVWVSAKRELGRRSCCALSAHARTSRCECYGGRASRF